MSRNPISTIGAMMPQLAKPGSTPMKNVPMPIRVIVTRNVYFRPIKSPKWPKISAQNGRTAKPAANVSSANEADIGRDIREKVFGEERAQRAVDIKIIPLEHGPERGGEDHEPLLAVHPARLRCVDRHCRHVRRLPKSFTASLPGTCAHARNQPGWQA